MALFRSNELQRAGLPYEARWGEVWWRRWESNPCPQYNNIKALHAYSLLIPLFHCKDTVKNRGPFGIQLCYETKKPNKTVLSV